MRQASLRIDKVFTFFSIICGLLLSSCYHRRYIDYIDGEYSSDASKRRSAVIPVNKSLENKHLNDIHYSIQANNKSYLVLGEKTSTENSSLSTKRNNNAKKHKHTKPVIIKANSFILKQVDFSSLKEWQDDNFMEGLESFLNSCAIFNKYPARNKKVASKELVIGTPEGWLKVCKLGQEYYANGKAKEFFETFFEPFSVIDRKKNSSVGLFTGYHEFSINGSLVKTRKFPYALYDIPLECKTKRKRPCYTAKQIYGGSLKGKNLELAWVDTPYDIWRMQIQGSGLVEFGDGSYVRLNYGGNNGHEYKAIWKHVKRHKKSPSSKKNQNHLATMDWLRNNPKEAVKLLSLNPSYIFFTPSKNDTIIGSHQSILTPSRSLAVDPRYIPYGVPLWIETSLPVQHYQTKSWIPLNRLAVAQDTGGAIKGVVRADIFYGHGKKATYLAEHMHFKGEYFVLLPKEMIKHTLPK